MKLYPPLQSHSALGCVGLLLAIALLGAFLSYAGLPAWVVVLFAAGAILGRVGGAAIDFISFIITRGG